MIKLTSKNPEHFTGDLLVYLIEVDGSYLPTESGEMLNRALQHAWQQGDFKAEKEETFLFYPGLMATSEEESVAAKRVLMVGLGKREDDIDVRREQLRTAGGIIAKKGGELKAAEVLVVLPRQFILSSAEISQCVTEGLLLGNYRFDKYKTPDEEGKKKVSQVGGFILHEGGLSSSAVRRGMNRGRNAAAAAITARDMANEPGNGWAPADFADAAKKVAKKNSLKCKVIEKSVMKKLGMGGILGVNQGSVLPPKLVVVEYKTSKKYPTILLVGKGLTFDSGGISLKPASGMEDMKYDMCGGAAVLATMQAIAAEKPAAVNVIALIPATENLPASTALKPGDIITHYGGLTSEIINTDAEGRLILADALAYGIATYKPDAVVDLATLTGAVIVGLGHHRTGLLANNDQLADQLFEAGAIAGEPMWRLPLGAEYRKQIDSKIADIKNTGGKSAGTITAACYLESFVGDTPWAHMDIAGTAWDFTEKTYIPKGPSGTGVRTLLAFVKNWKPLKVNEES